MSVVTKYGVAALVFFALIAASNYTSYHWGYNAARLKQSETTIQALAKSAQHIIDEQSKLEIIHNIIDNDKDDSIVSNPVVLLTVDRVSTNCAGKTHC